MNMPLKIGSFVDVQAYKIDGELYRKWYRAKVLEDNEQHVVLLLNRVRVLESTGKRWFFEPDSLAIFPKDHLFNAVIRFENNATKTLYCNIASSFYIEQQTIKFIDYDIDIKWNYSDRFQVVDWNEFTQNAQYGMYTHELIDAVYRELEWLNFMYCSLQYIFSSEELNRKFLSYQNTGLLEV